MANLLFLLAVTVSTAEEPQDWTQPRKFHEINQDIRDAIRKEARAENPRQREYAIRQMAALYRELAEDPRVETSDTLKSYKAKVWSRLTRIRDELKKRQKREQRLNKTKVSQEEQLVLQKASESLAEQVSLMNYSLGGPSQVLSQTGGALGGGGVADHGAELIDLIERTIRPDFWDTNGGPGSIFYYAPLHALVVRATSEMHGDVGGLLRALRRAGM